MCSNTRCNIQQIGLSLSLFSKTNTLVCIPVSVESFHSVNDACCCDSPNLTLTVPLGIKRKSSVFVCATKTFFSILDQSNGLTKLKQSFVFNQSGIICCSEGAKYIHTGTHTTEGAKDEPKFKVLYQQQMPT